MEKSDKVVIPIKELQDMHEDLEKWLKKSPAEIKQILETLESCKISKQQLKSVSIHLIINKMSKAKPETEEHLELVNLARRVKNEWKKCLSSGKKRLQQGSGKKQNGGKNSSMNGTLPDLRDSNRNRALKTFYDLLSSEEAKNMAKDANPDFNFISNIALKKAIEIERSLYADTGRKYIDLIRERILILKNKNNPGLKAAVLLGSVSVKDFVEGDAHDLADEKTKKKLQEGKEWSMKALQSDFYIKNVEVLEGEFTCFKCKSRRIHTTQKQMRSADEPMTTFFFCTKCGNRWKMN